MKRMVERVRGEYLEMPGLSLTERQAQRLWHLDAEACRGLLTALVDSGFLRRTPHGGYVRADPGSPGARHSAHPRAETAS